MRVRWVAFVIIGASVGAIVWFGSGLQSELAPLEDRSRARVFVTAQEGATFEYMDDYIDEVVSVIKDTIPEYNAIISVTSPGFGAASSVNTGFITLVLDDPADRTRSQQEVADELSSVLAGYTGARTFVSQDQTIGGRRGGLPVQYVIQAPNFERLTEKTTGISTGSR